MLCEPYLVVKEHGMHQQRRFGACLNGWGYRSEHLHEVDEARWRNVRFTFGQEVRQQQQKNQLNSPAYPQGAVS
jgi:hypothetical protein